MALEIKIPGLWDIELESISRARPRLRAHAARADAAVFSLRAAPIPIVVDTGYRSNRSWRRSACAGSSSMRT